MKLAIIGDFNPNFRPHVATNEAIEHSLHYLNASLTVDWIPTLDIEANFDTITVNYQGFWIAPGSPYLEGHPFFIATLFVPQDNSSFEEPHKLITIFLALIINGLSR